MKKYFCLPFFAFFLCALLCAKGNPKLSTKELLIKRADGQTVKVVAEIADTDEKRMKGFMFRKKIPDGTGMLFVYDRDQEMHFWMKNTPTALSIAYIDYKGVIKDILNMEPFSLTDIPSSGLVRYALEVPQGWFGRIGIKAGDTLILY